MADEAFVLIKLGSEEVSLKGGDFSIDYVTLISFFPIIMVVIAVVVARQPEQGEKWGGFFLAIDGKVFIGGEDVNEIALKWKVGGSYSND